MGLITPIELIGWFYGIGVSNIRRILILISFHQDTRVDLDLFQINYGSKISRALTINGIFSVLIIRNKTKKFFKAVRLLMIK
jgi:hypothetical protein